MSRPVRPEDHLEPEADLLVTFREWWMTEAPFFGEPKGLGQIWPESRTGNVVDIFRHQRREVWSAAKGARRLLVDLNHAGWWQ